MDNYCTHKNEQVSVVRTKKRKIHACISPQQFWLSQVEQFRWLITGRMIRRGTFHSARK